MKLFENGVGRPSNEIKKKRKIFIASVIVAVTIIITISGLLLFGDSDTNNLKGASNGSYYINMSVKNSGVKINGCFIEIPVDIQNTKNNEIKITGAKISYSGSDAVLSSVKLNKTLAAKTEYRQNLKFNIKRFNTQIFDYKVVIYFTVKDKEYYKYDLYSVTTRSEVAALSSRITECKKATTKKATTKKPTTKKTTKKKTTAKKIIDGMKLTCPSRAYLNKEFICSTNLQGVNIMVGTVGAGSFDSGYQRAITTTSSKKNIAIRYASSLFQNYKSYIEKDNSGKEYIKVTVHASKKGYKAVSKDVKIYKAPTTNKTTSNKITLSCISSANLNEVFTCKTNKSGVTITVDKAKSLASGYSSSFKTTSSGFSKNIKYDSRLFTEYKSQIKKDKNGKKYIEVIVTATKLDQKVIRKIKIYE